MAVVIKNFFNLAPVVDSVKKAHHFDLALL